MRRRFVLAALLLMMVNGHALGGEAERPVAPEPGVARQLARYRAAHYRDVRYALQLEITPGAELLAGTVEIRFTADAAANRENLVLDWRVAKGSGPEQQAARVSHLEVNGHAMTMAAAVGDGAAGGDGARVINDHIVIPGARVVRGENVVRLTFASPISTAGSAVTRYRDREDNREYIYTLFVPSDASTAFPCFDQPDLKARFTLEVTAPRAWKVITNTAELAAESVTPGGDSGAARARWRFRQTEPISTYIFAFAAGEFAEFHDEASPLGTRLYVRRSKAERARRESAEIFRLNARAIDFFARYFDYKYPFSKYDLVIVPEFAYGGMEHAGATFLREEAMLFPTDPTANDLVARAELIFHEAAHQWFGDLVTMRWFDDLWLKEGFATFMAYKAIEALMPEHSAWKVFYQRTKPAAYLTDATKGTTPIWQEISNLSAAKSAYGNIVYRKAPSFLRQAEFYLGADQFRRAVRLFLKEHAFGNAAWDDLVRAFERTSNRDLTRWAEAWVKRRGMPDVRVSWSAGPTGRINHFTLTHRDALGEGGAWPAQLKILLAYDGGGGKNAASETLTVRLDAAGEIEVSEALGKRRPAFVFANYEDYGYGRFLLDDKSRAYVIRNLAVINDDFLRALLWGSLWDSVREADLAPADYVELALRHVTRERDEVTAQAILARTQMAFNRYLSDDQRRQIAPRLERLVFSQMMGAETQGLRITYFRAYQGVATTDAARRTLYNLLSGELRVPGMTLRSRDRFDIITALLARDGDDVHALAALHRQRAADTTDDGRRYAFAAEAARPDPAIKRQYFNAYLGDSTLAESWIEASLNSFNTILQADLTRPYLDAALRELPALKRTRKIFFVNGWLAAFIGGQCDERALTTVEDFLRRESALDRDLHLKVLEAADGLERCVHIKTKFGAAPANPPPQRR